MKRIRKSSLIRAILICLAILLFTQTIRKYNLWVKFDENQAISIEFTLIENKENCQFFEKNYRFLIDNCFSYQTGSRLLVVGRVVGVSDSGFLTEKKLDVEDVSLISDKLDSDIDWLVKIRVWLLNTRKLMIESVMGYIPGTYFHLINAMVFGEKNEALDLLNQEFKVTGMQHVMAVSGFNITMIAMLANGVISRFRRFQSFFLWIVLVGCYVMMTDLSISVVRAFLMGFLKKGGVLIGQKNYHNLRILAMSFLMILLYKVELLASISFQLSMSASLGIILFMPIFGNNDPIHESSENFSLKALFKESLLTTLAAQSFTLPILLFHFSSFSLVSIIANVFMLWLTPFITVGGLLFIIFGSVLSLWSIGRWLLQALSLFLYLPTKLFTDLLHFFSQFDQFYLEDVTMSFRQVVIYWFLLIALYLVLLKKDESHFKKHHPVYHL